MWGDNADSGSDEEEEYFQEGYEESFIDDDEEVGNGPELEIDPATLPSSRGDDDEEGNGGIDVDPLAVMLQRNHQAHIVVSSDEDDGDYTDADTHGDYVRSWNEDEDEDGVYHDARSDSDYHGDNNYGSDDDSQGSFYGYL